MEFRRVLFRSAVIKAALGDEAVKLTGFLAQGGSAMAKATEEAEKYGAIVDEKAVKSSQNFMKELNLLSTELSTRFSNALGSAAEAATPLVKSLRDLFSEMEKQGLAQAVELGFFKQLSDKQLQTAMDTLRKNMEEMQAAADKAAKNPSFWESLFGSSDNYLAAVKKMREEIATIEAEVDARQAASRLRGTVADKGAQPSAAVPGMATQLQQKPLGPWQTSLDFSGVDAMSRVRSQGATDPLERIALEQEQELESFRRLLADKKIDEGEYAEAREAINRASSVKIMQAVQDESDNARAKFQEVEAAIAGPLTSAFQGIFSTGQFSAKSFFAEVLTGLANVATQAMIVKPLMDAIFAGASGGLMGGGGLVAGLGSLLGFAHGGPTIGNRPVMVGERGPEIFVPSTSGRVMTGAQAGRSMGGAQSVTMNFQIQGDATDSTVERFRHVAQQDIARYAQVIVTASDQRVASEHRRDPGYLRR
jgi:hypothetical protein